MSDVRWMASAFVGVLVLTGCLAPDDDGGAAAPSSPAVSSTPAASPSPTKPSLQDLYVRAAVADRPIALWPLDDANGEVGDIAMDVAGTALDAEIVEAPVRATTGPFRTTRAAQFTGSGRLVSRVADHLQPGRPFTIEFLFRADDCTREWTQVVGTAEYGPQGREGVNVLHYPRFHPSGCHVAVEFWRHDTYTGGCGSASVLAAGRWRHFAITYDGRVARCFEAGRLIGSGKVPTFGVGSDPTFGIGGAGSGYAGSLDSGSLAAVAVYDRALLGRQVREHALSMP